MTPAERLAAAGQLLHGEDWKAPLARDLGISAKQIGRWASGHTPFPATHGVLRDVAGLLHERSCALLNMELDMRRTTTS